MGGTGIKFRTMRRGHWHGKPVVVPSLLAVVNSTRSPGVKRLAGDGALHSRRRAGVCCVYCVIEISCVYSSSLRGLFTQHCRTGVCDEASWVGCRANSCVTPIQPVPTQPRREGQCGQQHNWQFWWLNEAGNGPRKWDLPKKEQVIKSYNELQQRSTPRA